MITLQTPNDNIKHFINGNKTVLYTYNTERNIVKLEYSNNFDPKELSVINNKGERVSMSLYDIVRAENNFIKKVEVIASTIMLPIN